MPEIDPTHHANGNCLHAVLFGCEGFLLSSSCSCGAVFFARSRSFFFLAGLILWSAFFLERAVLVFLAVSVFFFQPFFFQPVCLFPAGSFFFSAMSFVFQPGLFFLE